MNNHKNARLTPFSRALLVRRILTRSARLKGVKRAFL
ncbi:hypothetical protein C1926_17350 [Stenotrophomonas sp. ZAC14A_NAIMI4_1]|nr:hypothetical protein C1926_17350 [Stenotrophomonas sp. ZAC14A_NAIMI4_1]